MKVPLFRQGRWTTLAIGLLLAAPAAGLAEEVPYGLVRLPPIMTSHAAPLRRALVVAPGEDSPRSGSDGAAYRDTLRLLGFEVSLVTGSTRPELDAALRSLSTPSAGDLAVFLVGRIVPDGRDLFLLPADAEFTGEPFRRTEGLQVRLIVQRLLPPNGGETIVVADGCRDRPAGAACADSLGDLPAGVSLAVISGGQNGSGSARELVPLMEQEGLAFVDVVAALQKRATHSGLKIAASAPLSHTFSFLPAGFLAGLPLACNNTDPGMSAESLRRTPPLGALVAACEQAGRQYGFSPYFQIRLAAVREQRAAQAALGCESVASAAYIADYPEGRYRDDVLATQKSCATPKPSPGSPDARNFPQEPPLSLASAPNPLQAGAVAAVLDYFRRRDYEQSGSFGGLVRLYPPKFREGQAVVARNDYLRDLGTWYGAYDSVRFEILPDTLDASLCLDKQNCLVRGTARARMLKAGESQYAWEEDRFALRLDLTANLILAQCGVAGPTSTKQEACN